jgi:cyclic dehypoxanthinyl futalosine synthase
VCTAKCTFCAFRRDATDHDAYTLEKEQLFEKVAELRAIGGTQVLMQGGMNPELPLDWYLDLLREHQERFPGIHIHGFSPPEFIEFVNFFDPPGADARREDPLGHGPPAAGGARQPPGRRRRDLRARRPSARSGWASAPPRRGSRRCTSPTRWACSRARR